MVTKKELAERFEIGNNTVYRTLQSTPLGTNKKDYSEEEIKEFFIPARELLNGGQTYQEVAEYFGLKEPVGAGEVPEDEREYVAVEDNAGNYGTDSTSKIVEEQLSVAAAEAVNELSDRSVKNVAPFVGDLLMYKLAEELQEGGVIRKSIDETLEQVKTATPTQKGKVSGGAAFLLNKMKGNGLKQLAGRQTQTAQLPASSTESSETKSEQESQS